MPRHKKRILRKIAIGGLLASVIGSGIAVHRTAKMEQCYKQVQSLAEKKGIIGAVEERRRGLWEQRGISEIPEKGFGKIKGLGKIWLNVMPIEKQLLREIEAGKIKKPKKTKPVPMERERMASRLINIRVRTKAGKGAVHRPQLARSSLRGSGKSRKGKRT